MGEEIALLEGLVNVDGAWMKNGVAAWLLGAGPRLHLSLSQSLPAVTPWPGKPAFALARLEGCIQ